MSVVSAQSITVDFTTRNGQTGVGVNGDSLPTGTLVKNGTDNGATVTVTNVSTGVYKAAVTLPTLAIGDILQLRIAATVNSVSDAAIVWTDTCDLNIDASGRVDVGKVLGTASAGAAGYVGVDWGQVTNKTTTNALTGTTLSTSLVVASVSGAVGSVTGSVGSISGITFPTNFSATQISSGGFVGIDWNNIHAPTTTVALSGTTISNSQVVASVTGNVGGSVATVTSIAAGAIDVPQFTTTVRALTFRSYMVLTGTTSPVTADTYVTTGLYNGVVYLESTTLGTPMFVWNSSGTWYITPVLGTVPSSGTSYFSSASSSAGPYSLVVNSGSGSGTITSTAHGNAILAAFQPEAPNFTAGITANITGNLIGTVSTLTTYTGNTPQTGDAYARLGAPATASVSGDIAAVKTVTLALPSDSSIQSDVATGLTNQGYTPTRAGYLDTLNGLVAAIWGYATRVLTAFGFTPNANVTQVGGTNVSSGILQSADHTAIQTDVTSGLTTQGWTSALSAALALVPGLVGQNQGLRNFSYSGANLQSFDCCIYDTAGHAATNDGSTGLLHKWTISITNAGTNMQTQVQQQIS